MSMRAFSVEDVMAAADLPGVDLLSPWRRVTKYELIAACEKVHICAVQDRPFSAGVATLAHWLVRNRHVHLGAFPPFDDGERIERILAGIDQPDDEMVKALQRVMTAIDRWDMPRFSVQSFSAMPPRQGSSAARGPNAGANAGGDAPSPDRSFFSPGPAAALPAMGALGAGLPPGRLCCAVADSRIPNGFVLTFSGGVMLALDEAMAMSASAAIADGIAHIRARRDADMEAVA